MPDRPDEPAPTALTGQPRHDETAARDPRHQRHTGEKIAARISRANFSGAIYGQVLVLSVIVAFGPTPPTPGRVLATVLSTQLVFWLAHAYAELTSRQVHAGGTVGVRGVWDVMKHEWPIMQAVTPTAILMVVVLLTRLETKTALEIAFAVGVVQLFGWGYAAARRAGRSTRAQLLSGALSGSFGLVIVALKFAVH